MNRVEPIKQNNICCRGTFIFAENLSQKERQAAGKFMEYALGNKTNAEIIRNKSYDIYVRKSEFKPDILRFFVPFMTIYSNDKREIFISSLNLNNKTRGETKFFRSELKWFEKYKKIAGGYNNWREKILVLIKDFCNCV